MLLGGPTLAPQLPHTELPTTPTATDKQSGIRLTLDWRVGFLATSIALFALYAVAVIFGVSIPDHPWVLAPQLHGIVVATLVLMSIGGIALVLFNRMGRRLDEQQQRADDQFVTLSALRCRRHGFDEPTDPLPARVIVRQPLVYAPLAERARTAPAATPYPADNNDGRLDIDEATRIYLAGLYDAERRRGEDEAR
jgi:hypothetical protein